MDLHIANTACSILLLTSWLTGMGRMEAAPITLTTLVRTNDPAPGVGPTTIFIYSSPNSSSEDRFGAPVAASDGYFAFRGAARNTDNTAGGGRGIWAGRAGSLTGLSIQRQIAPGMNTDFTQIGLMNLSDAGEASFFSETRLGSGLWWSDLNTGATELAQRLSIVPQSLPVLRPLQTSNFVAFLFGTTNWVYNTRTKQLTAASYTGMAASVFGGGVTLSGAGTILALMEDGRLLIQGNTSDGTNRIFLANGPSDLVPALAQGQSAPGVTNQWVGIMSATGNARGMLAVLTRLQDGDPNSFNDRSALFAGPVTNVALIAVSPPGQFWGGKPLISRANHIYGPSASGTGIYRLPDSPTDSLTFTPIPDKPYPPRPGASGLSMSLNALGQFVEFYGTSPGSDPFLPGTDLWLFNPGDGWTNIARGGSNLVASGQTILVQSIGFQGNYWFAQSTGAGGGGYPSSGGAGYPSGLADDGALYFSVNGTHIITTALPPCPELARALAFHRVGLQAIGEEFIYNGKQGTNWHASTADCPPETNWETATGVTHPLPPGDAAPNTARVVIPPLSDVLLDQRAAPIGSLASDGHLTLRERLTVNRIATATDLVVEGPSGGVILTNGGQMTVDNTLWKTGTLSMADGQIPASFASIDTFLAESGTIEALSGNPVFETYGTFRKDSPGEFTVQVPFNVVEPATGPKTTRTDVIAGRLGLVAGGTIEGAHTFSVSEGATLDLFGEYLVGGITFRSNGIVNLGTSNQPIFLGAPSGSTVWFNAGNVRFNRGEFRGGAIFLNEGGFTWDGGAIIMGLAGGFENRGDLLIDFRPNERKLNGTFRHRSGTFSQFGDVDLSGDGITQADGAIINNGPWSLFGPCRITGSNGLVVLEGIRFDLIDFFLYRSHSKFKVESGLVEVESAFDNQDADVIVGDGATLRLRNVKNIQGTQLYRGIWEIGPGGLLETPGAQIEQVALGEDSGDGFSDHPTAVLYGGRGWPQFRPNKNAGYIVVTTNLLLRTLENSGLVWVKAMGHLEIEGNFVQFKGGPNATQGELSCDAGRVTIAGDFVTSRGSLGVSREGVVNLAGQLINDNGVVGIGDFFGEESDNAAELNVKDTIINQGSILLWRNGVLRTQSGFVNDPIDESDRLSLENGAEVLVTGEFLNRGRVVVEGSSTLTLFGSMVNEGQKGAGNITVSNRGELHVQGDLSLDSPATSLIIRSLGSVVVGGLLTSAGAVRLEQGSLQIGALRFSDQATLDGNGVMIGNVTTYGLVSPGFSPGALSVVGNFDQTNTSVLVIELAGIASSQFDRFLVSQAASIGGTLAINLLDGFRPGPNDTFSILEAGALTNQFANATNGQRLATFGGFGSFQVNYTQTNVVLSAFEENPTPAPTAPASLKTPTLGLDSLQLKLTGTAGREYLIETSTNLVSWSIATTNIAGFDGKSLIELPVSADSYRFFRALAK